MHIDSIEQSAAESTETRVPRQPGYKSFFTAEPARGRSARMHILQRHDVQAVAPSHACRYDSCGDRTERDLDELRQLLGQHGLSLVFVNVLLTQLGIPIPSLPILVVAGALVAEGTLHTLPLA